MVQLDQVALLPLILQHFTSENSLECKTSQCERIFCLSDLEKNQPKFLREDHHFLFLYLSIWFNYFANTLRPKIFFVSLGVVSNWGNFIITSLQKIIRQLLETLWDNLLQSRFAEFKQWPHTKLVSNLTFTAKEELKFIRNIEKNFSSGSRTRIDLFSNQIPETAPFDA
jgi:hypothetical protein